MRANVRLIVLWAACTAASTGCSGGGGSGPLPAASLASPMPPVSTSPTPSATATSAASTASAALTGRVVDDSGQGVAGAVVSVGSATSSASEVYRRLQAMGRANGGAQLEERRGTASAANAATASDGSFTIAGLANGLTPLQIAAPGYAAYNTGVTLTGARLDLGTIALHRISSDEAAWLARVNADRALYNNAPVAFDETAYRAALAHASDMAANNYFSHEDPAGRKPYVRYGLLGGIGFESENIAAGYASALDAESAFMGESAVRGGHFLNIEDAAHDWVGLAAATAPAGTPSTYGTYYDQEFVNLSAVWDPSIVARPVALGSSVAIDVLVPASAGTVLASVGNEPAPTATTPPGGSYAYPANSTTLAPAPFGTSTYRFNVAVTQPGLDELVVFASAEPTAPFTITNGAVAMPIIWTK